MVVVGACVVGDCVVDEVGSLVVELVVEVFPGGNGKFMKFVAMPRVIPCPLERPDPNEFPTSCPPTRESDFQSFPRGRRTDLINVDRDFRIVGNQRGRDDRQNACRL